MHVNSATLPPPSSAFRSGSSAARSSLGSCSSRVTPIVMCGKNVEASTSVPAMSSRSCGASTSTTTAEWKQFTRWYTASNAPLWRNSCARPPVEVAPASHTCKKCSGTGASHSKLARAPWSSRAACLISFGGTTTQPSAERRLVLWKVAEEQLQRLSAAEEVLPRFVETREETAHRSNLTTSEDIPERWPSRPTAHSICFVGRLAFASVPSLVRPDWP